eukprot:scaffold1694_cov199-Chaetoceros_neogracile.AAC.1
MNSLSKDQKDELATSMAVLALYDGGACLRRENTPRASAEISSEQIKVLLEATGNTKVEAFYPIIFANFLSNPEKVAELISNPGGSGGGGGDGAAAGDGAAEVIEEEEPEEEEAGPGDAVDMFGGDDAGGDY